MLRLPVVSRLGRQLARFARAEQGNYAVIFAIALVPVLSFVGAAVDYSRAVKARTSMQAALDSAALMLSKDLSSGAIATSQISTKATTYFNALFTDKSALPSVTVTATYTASTSAGSTIQLTGDGNFTTTFMKIAGFPKLGINASSAWGTVRMRVAMVLDNTGSMADAGKMPAMQTAAKNLIDQLSALAKADGDIYISIVPFAKDVNVGADNYSKYWIDFTDWDAANGSCSSSRYTNQSSCVNNSKTWTPANHNTWTGCVVDRDQDYDIKNTTPTNGNSATLFPADQYSYCTTGSSADRAAELQLVLAQDGDRQHEADRQHQPGHWSRLGLDDIVHGRSHECARQGFELYLQGRHRPAVRRAQHAEPLVQQRLADRRAADEAVRQCQGREHHDLHGAGQYRRRSDLRRAAILRQQQRQVLPGPLGKPDRLGVPEHRHVAVEAARGTPTRALRKRKKPG